MIGYEEPGRDCVATDLTRREVNGKPLRKIRHTRFRRRVCGNFRERTERVHRRNIYDIAARFHHPLGENLRYQKRRRDIEVENKFKSAFVEREKVFYPLGFEHFGRHGFVVASGFRVVPVRAVYENSMKAKWNRRRACSINSCGPSRTRA